MGERRNGACRVDFDRALRVEFHGVKVTSDAGLRVDPAMRHVVGGRAKDKLGASTSEMSRFETEMLPEEGNVQVLAALPGRWVKHVTERTGLRELILDLDSSDSPTHGRQEGSAYNGHFGYTCYHPLFCFNQLGDLLGAMLRRRNVHSANEWQALLNPIVEQYRSLEIPKFFRGDAAFAIPELYAYLEGEGYSYAIRLKANNVLRRHIAHLLRRPVGRPPRKPKVF